MNKKQDQLERIMEYNRRSPLGADFKGLYDQFYTHFQVVVTHFKNNPGHGDALSTMLIRHSYILTVAFIQECVKKWIKELVDSDFNFVVKISKEKRVEFDIHQINHFIEKKVSLGDFIAHNYIPNSMEEISKLFNILFEKDIYFQMKALYDENNLKDDIEVSFGVLVEMLNNCFKKRHIVAHELSPLTDKNGMEIFDVVMGAILLVNSLAPTGKKS